MARFLIPLFIVAFLLTACGSKPLAEVNVPFTGESVMNAIAGEPYRFFRYEAKEAAQADIAKVSSDGHEISGRRIPWEGPVHIYFKLKRIVIYVGSNPVVIKTIEDVFGPQTAGDPVEAGSTSLRDVKVRTEKAPPAGYVTE